MTHGLNNPDQHIRSEVRFLLIYDFLRCSRLHKAFQHLMITSVRIFYQRIQLSIRKRSCAAFSKLYIGLRIKNPVFPETINRFLTLLRFLSALQYQRPITRSCQIPCTEKTCRSASDNYRRILQNLFTRFWETIFFFLKKSHIFISVFAKQLLFCRSTHVYCIDKFFIIFMAGIQRLTYDFIRKSIFPAFQNSGYFFS